MVVQNFLKLLYFIRVFEAFGFLVKMISETLGDMINFIIYFILWIILFTLLFFVLKLDLDPSDQKKYDYVED